jgi:uncharacterized protein YbjT (DUF2867 family)
MASSIKNVIVIGASGSIGPHIVSALLENGFSVSALTRTTSSATFPSTVIVYRTDYSKASLVEAFEGQDAVVSGIATFSAYQQADIIDAAVAAGVKRFVPSEYGVDTSLPQIAELLPPALPKQKTVEYLRAKESFGLSWTGVVVGGFFDWALQIPGLLAWNLPARTATIFDGGDVEFEATNVAQIARGVAAALSSAHVEDTKNKYIYINSFTITQNQILSALEEVTGDKFVVTHSTKAELAKQALEMLKSWETSSLGYPVGSLELITAAIYGNGGLNEFSKTKGLWNERLGLPKEDLKETVAWIVKKNAAGEK